MRASIYFGMLYSNLFNIYPFAISWWSLVHTGTTNVLLLKDERKKKTELNRHPLNTEWMRAHFRYWSLVYRRQRFQRFSHFSYVYLFGHVFLSLDFFRSFMQFFFFSTLARPVSAAAKMNGKMKLFTSPCEFSCLEMVFLFARLFFLLLTANATTATTKYTEK